jgi:RES domain-containing protein
MQVWRICKKIYANRAFSGEGGLKAPGRWHHMGHLIVYTSESLSVATIGTWVHVGPQSPLPDHIALPAEIPDYLAMHEIGEAAIPPDWKSSSPPSLLLRDIGTEWLMAQRSAVARVPAGTTPGECNYLLNPLHPDFRTIRPGQPQPFEFDPRMWK